MTKPSTVRAEIARYRIKQREIAACLSIPTDVISQILNEKQDKPDLLWKIWEYVQARKAAAER